MARCNARAGRRGGALIGGLAMARWRQDVVGYLEGATGRVPGKEERAAAHRNGGSTVRRRRRRGSVVTPVVIDEGGWVLQLEGDPG
jgi:hypothetical protein